jgi:hypothetical protein
VADPLVQIQINGASLVIINQQVYAALLSTPGPATWVVTADSDGSFVFTDQASGLLLSDAATTTDTPTDSRRPSSPRPAPGCR